jgi:RNA polymerase sigma factor (sigma-70 family)
MTEIERNNLVKTYEPLVNKLTKQFVDKVHYPWAEIKSMAYEGLAIALNTYNPDRSKMTFTQFAGFAIRNNILTCLNDELRTIKMSPYAQKLAAERGEALFNTVSIDIHHDSNDKPGRYDKNHVWCKVEEAKFSDGDVFETLYSKLEENFSTRDCEIFYRTFGLKDYDEEKGRDIAKYFGISCSLVSNRLKKVITFIQKDEDLVEILANLLK